LPASHPLPRLCPASLSPCLIPAPIRSFPSPIGLLTSQDFFHWGGGLIRGLIPDGRLGFFLWNTRPESPSFWRYLSLLKPLIPPPFALSFQRSFFFSSVGLRVGFVGIDKRDLLKVAYLPSSSPPISRTLPPRSFPAWLQAGPGGFVYQSESPVRHRLLLHGGLGPLH